MILNKILSASADSDLTEIAFDLLQKENIITLIKEMSELHISFDKSFEFDITTSQLQDSINISYNSKNYDINRSLHDRLLLLAKNNIALQKNIALIMQKFYD